MLKRLKNNISKIFKYLKNNWQNILVLILSIAFASYLMFSTFNYRDNSIGIKEKLYSDFTSHIPLIRSFSIGDNYPIEYPHFPNEPIKYHFLFYLLVGLLEKVGLRIDIALNLLSIIGFAGLLYIIYLLAYKLTKSKFIGIGSILVIIFNPSLSFLYYFLIGDNTLDSILDIFTTNTFGSFGPYDNNLISAFWNLNVYTNQRHFPFSLLLMFLSFFLILYKKGKKSLILAIILIGILSFMHKAVLLISFISLFILFLSFKNIQKRILIITIISLIISIPALLLLNGNTQNTYSPLFVIDPGFLYKSTNLWEFETNSLILRWLIYWLFNLGILPILSILGVLLMIFKNKKNKVTISNILNEKTSWFFIGLLLFVIANIFRFGPDMANNHKLINVTIILWGIYAFIFIKNSIVSLNIFGKIITLILTIILLLGGICDLFPIINDKTTYTEDIFTNTKSIWVINNTKPKDIFLNLTSDFSFVTYTGRKIYLGVAYFNWSLGYPVDDRNKLIQELVDNSFPKDNYCDFLYKENINYFYYSIYDNKLLDKDFNPELSLKDYLDKGIKIQDIVMFNRDNICQ